MPRNRILLNSKLISWAGSKQNLKYVLTGYRLLNHNGALYRQFKKNYTERKEKTI